MEDLTAQRLKAVIRVLRKQLWDAVQPKGSLSGISRVSVTVLAAIARSNGGSDTGGGSDTSGNGGNEPASPTQIAAECHMATSNVAASLKELESAGLIERRRSDKDARRTTVHLTDQGRSTVATHRALRTDAMSELIQSRLTSGERTQLESLLPILEKLGDIKPDGDDGPHVSRQRELRK